VKVKDIMRSTVICCRPDSNLAEAADLLWSSDCGVLPVVDTAGKVIGIITDRDICVAVGSRNCAPSEIVVRNVACAEVSICKGEDDILFALDIMRVNLVRRLPVVNEAGILQGLLSLDDIILSAESTGGITKPKLSFEDVMPVLKAICQHHALPLSEPVFTV